MNWKTKAAIQSVISILPRQLAYDLYYSIQRRNGALRPGSADPFSRLIAGLATCEKIIQNNRIVNDRTFFEIGTGRRINAPIAYWLLGAKKTITVDLNPYLKEELIISDISKLQENEDCLMKMLSAYSYDKDRLKALLEINLSDHCLESLLNLFRIEYLAPHDARLTKIPNSHVDYHTSYTVLEHIPPEIVEAIFREGLRITNNNGLFVHFIDYSDHFAHTDHRISRINFLKYSQKTWGIIAGNRFMYMSRIRHSEMLKIIKDITPSILINAPTINRKSLQILKEKKIKVSPLFRNHTVEDLATDSAWIVSEKQR